MRNGQIMSTQERFKRLIPSSTTSQPDRASTTADIFPLNGKGWPLVQETAKGLGPGSAGSSQ